MDLICDISLIQLSSPFPFVMTVSVKLLLTKGDLFFPFIYYLGLFLLLNRTENWLFCYINL